MLMRAQRAEDCVEDDDPGPCFDDDSASVALHWNNSFCDGKPWMRILEHHCLHESKEGQDQQAFETCGSRLLLCALLDLGYGDGDVKGMVPRRIEMEMGMGMEMEMEVEMVIVMTMVMAMEMEMETMEMGMIHRRGAIIIIRTINAMSLPNHAAPCLAGHSLHST